MRESLYLCYKNAKGTLTASDLVFGLRDTIYCTACDRIFLHNRKNCSYCIFEQIMFGGICLIN